MAKLVAFILGCFFSFSALGAEEITPLSLSSSSVIAGRSIPVKYTCQGDDISPAVTWTHTPQNVKALALILSDPDAPNGVFYHWGLYNISPETTNLPENLKQLPSETLAVKNSWGDKNYKGPCPPTGTTHHYTLTVYALDKKLDLPADATVENLLQDLKNHVITQGELTFIYSKQSGS